MIELLKAAVLGLFAWTVVSLLIAWLLALLYPLFRSLIRPYPAQLRSSLALLFALAPYSIALIILCLYSSPKWSLLFVSEHCHSGICGPHDLHMPVASSAASGVVMLAMASLVLVAYFIWRQLRLGRRYSSALAVISQPKAGVDFRLIQTAKPAAWCVGLLKPQIYLSQGLIDKVSASQLQIIFAHEYAHLTRRDNLRKLLLHWSSLPWPNTLKTRIRSDFLLDGEYICDLAAVTRHQQNSNDMATTLELIEQYCSDHGMHNRHSISERLTRLEQELDFMQQSTGEYWRRLIKINVAAISVTAVLLTIAAHLSHPLLEWLSQ